MYIYPKIPTLFKRATDGSKKLLEGVYWSSDVLKYANSTWVMTEKVDGSNMGIVWDGKTITYQGRKERAILKGPILGVMYDYFSSVETFQKVFGDEEAVIFGEVYGPNVRLPYSNTNDFIMFDVFLPKKKRWLNREELENVAKAFKVKVVPIIMTGTLDEAIAYVKSNPKSTLGDVPMEGLVCRPVGDPIAKTGNRVTVKVKWEDFKDV